MSNVLYMVITNCGDGSNAIQWVADLAVLDKMEERADEGDETYASGEGLQVTELIIPDPVTVEQFIWRNGISLTTIEDME